MPALCRRIRKFLKPSRVVETFTVVCSFSRLPRHNSNDAAPAIDGYNDSDKKKNNRRYLSLVIIRSSLIVCFFPPGPLVHKQRPPRGPRGAVCARRGVQSSRDEYYYISYARACVCVFNRGHGSLRTHAVCPTRVILRIVWCARRSTIIIRLVSSSRQYCFREIIRDGRRVRTILHIPERVTAEPRRHVTRHGKYRVNGSYACDTVTC